MEDLKQHNLDQMAQIVARRFRDTIEILKRVKTRDPKTNDEIYTWTLDFKITGIFVPEGSTERRGNTFIVTETAKVLTEPKQAKKIKTTHRVKARGQEFAIKGKPKPGNILVQINLEETS